MRQPNVIRPVKLTTTLPEDIRAKLDLYLWSDFEGRIPKSAYQQFFIARIKEFFGSSRLDLNDWGIFPAGDSVLRGSPSAIEALRNLLNGATTNDKP